MRTHKFNTLKCLLRSTRQYSLYTFLSGRIYHNKKGWVNYKLSDSLHDEIKGLFESFLGISINLNVSTCGAFERLLLSNRGVSYCAGQDYPAEIRNLKRWLK